MIWLALPSTLFPACQGPAHTTLFTVATLLVLELAKEILSFPSPGRLPLGYAHGLLPPSSGLRSDVTPSEALPDGSLRAGLRSFSIPLPRLYHLLHLIC